MKDIEAIVADNNKATAQGKRPRWLIDEIIDEVVVEHEADWGPIVIGYRRGRAVTNTMYMPGQAVGTFDLSTISRKLYWELRGYGIMLIKTMVEPIRPSRHSENVFREILAVTPTRHSDSL